ncbi:MAG: cbb3-type cytochrome oxidase assembly protein CcoS [Geminicoccales bacterium]
MTAALYLIPISLGLGLLALIACVWTIRAGQYDNLETERYRILEDDQAPLSEEEARHRRTLSKRNL